MLPAAIGERLLRVGLLYSQHRKVMRRAFGVFHCHRFYGAGFWSD